MSEQHLALLYRFGDGTLQLLTQKQPAIGPWANFWHLPQICPQDAQRRGMTWVTSWPAPGWSPNGAQTTVWAQEVDSSSAQAIGLHALLGFDDGRRHTLWASPLQLTQNHHLGLMVLSHIVWEIVSLAKALVAVALPLTDAAPIRTIAKAVFDVVRGAKTPQEVALAHHISALPLRTPTLAPATHTNCYVLGHKRLIVVDPGTPYVEGTQFLLQALRRRVAGGARIEAIWLSHFHDDHIGAAMAVHRAFAAPILAHRDTARALSGRVVVHRTIDDGTLLPVEDDCFEALHTPGHAVGHLCFWSQKHGHLLSGDNILGTGTPIVPGAPHGSMTLYLDSLRRLAARPLGLLLPGHGPPCALAASRLKQTLEARLNREALLLRVLAESSPGTTLEALITRVYRGLGPALRGLAEQSTLSHLEKLVLDGRVERVEEGARTLWRRTIAEQQSLR